MQLSFNINFRFTYLSLDELSWYRMERVLKNNPNLWFLNIYISWNRLKIKQLIISIKFKTLQTIKMIKWLNFKQLYIKYHVIIIVFMIIIIRK